MTTEVVLGVDIGTTATKVVAVDVGGAVHGSGRRAYPLEEPSPGQAVQDPTLIVAAVVDAVREVVAMLRSAGTTVAGVSFSSAMHSLMALDAADQPLTPLIIWADERAIEQAERLRPTEQGRAIHQRTGTPIHPMSPLVKLIWFGESQPEVAARAARWVGIKEYVIANLCGAWVIDHSMASGTGLMDIHIRRWDHAALELAGVDASQLSMLAPTTEVRTGLLAERAAAMGLDDATPLVIGAGDGPLANLGIGAVRPGVAACSIGTSGAIRVAVDRPAVDEHGQVFCYELGSSRWVVGGAINNGGVMLKWLQETIADSAAGEMAVLESAAEAPPGSGGLLMLPYLFGERAPHWGALARGAYVGLTHAHRREHLLRAAVEGICLQLAVVLDSVRAAGMEVHEVRATGGFAHSEFWRQLLTDALGIDVHFPQGSEGSAVGAALLGLHALGRIADLDSTADLIRVAEVRHPDADAAALYAELRPVYASLYDALAPANSALHRLQVHGDRRTLGHASVEKLEPPLD
ncbi:MAG: gluconokinase [Candidatus Dormibacteraeota bacterium]|uniref:Gluconokinase n=1 Tax=Candidatus Amunia macphersoniae TaxID=3127014 RepID=A0A934KPP5_9BACT|nr:gluconokinase [Candidatus Dormibacteraeota bacterium]